MFLSRLGVFASSINVSTGGIFQSYDIGVEQGSGFSNQDHFGYGDDRANAVFYGTISPSASFQTKRTIRRLTVLNDGSANLEIFQDGGTDLPQDAFSAIELEGIGLLNSADATYTPTGSVGFGGEQFTKWVWSPAQTGIASNVDAGWTSGATRTVNFYSNS